MVFVGNRRMFGDAIEDALAGPDTLLAPSYAAQDATNVATPAPSGQSTGLIPISSTGPGAPGGSGQSWTSVFQNIVSSVFHAGGAPSSLNKPAPSTSTSTGTIIAIGGGVAVVGLVAYLLLRRPS